MIKGISVVLQLAMLVCLGLTIRELRSVRSELATIKQQMETPVGLRSSRGGGGVPVYITGGPAMP